MGNNNFIVEYSSEDLSIVKFDTSSIEHNDMLTKFETSNEKIKGFEKVKKNMLFETLNEKIDDLLIYSVSNFVLENENVVLGLISFKSNKKLLKINIFVTDEFKIDECLTIIINRLINNIKDDDVKISVRLKFNGLEVVKYNSLSNVLVKKT